MRAQSQDYAKPSDLIRVSQAIPHISHNRGENPSPGPGGVVHSLFLGHHFFSPWSRIFFTPEWMTPMSPA